MAFFSAAAVPLRASGVATEQAALGIALLGALILTTTDTVVRTNLKNALTSPLARALGTMFLAWAVTVPFSHAPMGSLEIGGRVALFIFGITVVWAALRRHDETHAFFLKTVIVAALVLSVLPLLALNSVPGVISLLKGQYIAFERPIFAFKAYAAAAMCLIPVVVWAGRRLDGAWRWWGYGFPPLVLALMVQTHNRSALAGFLAMCLAGIFALALAKRKHAKALFATFIAGGVGLIVWIANKETSQIEAVVNKVGHNIQAETYLPLWLLDPHRQNIWKFAFERFLDHPWVGNGIDQINRLPGAQELVRDLGSDAFVMPSHPHNWALEVLAETGLVGFIPVLAVIGYIAWKTLKAYLHSSDERALAVLTLMAGFWTSALFNFSIWAAWWLLTLFALFAILHVPHKQDERQDQPNTPPTP